MLSNYSIVMLKKDKYDQRQIEPKVDPVPRVLIIRVFDNTQQYIVRYPNGFTDRVNTDWIRGNGIYEPGHPSYATIATHMSAVEQEFRRNQPFREFLERTLSTLYTHLTQTIEAKNQAAQERQHVIASADTPTLEQYIKKALPKVAPDLQDKTNQPDIIMLLTSIDNSLKHLVQLWEGK